MFMRKLLPFMIFVVSVPSCSSTQTMEVGCQFVTGAFESEQKRRRYNEKYNQKHESDNVDVINGMLSVISIPLSDGNEKCAFNK